MPFFQLKKELKNLQTYLPGNKRKAQEKKKLKVEMIGKAHGSKVK
jgi:hypothetical protein